MRGLFVTSVMFMAFAICPGVVYAEEQGKGSLDARQDPETGERYDLDGQGALIQRNFGIGLQVGNPSGLSAKYYFDPWNALAVAAGYWSGPRVSYFRLHFDYLFHPGPIAAGQDIYLRLYFGGGLKLASVTQEQPNDNSTTYGSLGVRAPLGLLADFKGAPIDIFAELAPATYILPDFYPDLDFGFGARYYFQ